MSSRKWTIFFHCEAAQNHLTSDQKVCWH